MLSALKLFFFGNPEPQNDIQKIIDARIMVTVSCRDSSIIPKVVDAGKIIFLNGEAVQVMHEGTKVIAGGYCGDWMTKIITGLKGHHEPQEELAFYEILKHINPGSLMVELGSNWAYYSNWFLGAIHNGNAICIEPDLAGLLSGQKNMSLNQRNAMFIRAAVGKHYDVLNDSQDHSLQDREEIPLLNFADIIRISGNKFIDIIHMDIQGAELPFIESMEGSDVSNHLRFIFISTHHESISGSFTTHQDCIEILKSHGATILLEHTIEESFSGDGLIIGSFNPDDKNIIMPTISKNILTRSLFYLNN